MPFFFWKKNRRLYMTLLTMTSRFYIGALQRIRVAHWMTQKRNVRASLSLVLPFKLARWKWVSYQFLDHLFLILGGGMLPETAKKKVGKIYEAANCLIKLGADHPLMRRCLYKNHESFLCKRLVGLLEEYILSCVNVYSPSDLCSISRRNAPTE